MRWPRQRLNCAIALPMFPYVFNLGHGFVPETPPEHVAQLVKIIRGV